MPDPRTLRPEIKLLVAKQRDHHRQRLRSEVAAMICGLMVQQDVNQTELADLIGVSQPRINAILSGDENLTLEIVADVFLCLGAAAHLFLAPLLRGEYGRLPVEPERKD